MTANLFLSIPNDVLQTILHDWIGQDNAKDFVALDIAMCNLHCRLVYNSSLFACPISYKCTKWHPSKVVAAKFQLFFGWLKLRGMQLASLNMDNYPTKLLYWKLLGEVKELVYYNQEHIDLNEILKNLPQLKRFKLRGKGLMIFTTPSIPAMAKLKELKLLLKNIEYFDLPSLLEGLGRNAKMLTSLELHVNEGNYDNFYNALRYFPVLNELKYANKWRGITEADNGNILERYHAILETDNTEENKFRNIHTLWFEGDDEVAVLPVLSNCPNLIELAMLKQIGEDLLPLSSKFVKVVSESLPALKVLHLPRYCIANGIATLLSNIPSNTLETLELNDFDDEDLRLIANRQTALRHSILSSGRINSSTVGTLHFCQGTMMYLQELSLLRVDMSDEMYIALWISATTFPALRSLKLNLYPTDLLHDYVNDFFLIFKSLLSSPLSEQLVELHFTVGEICCDLSWIEGIYWKRMKRWEKLEKVYFNGIPIFQLDEFFQHAPNLREFDIGDGLDGVWRENEVGNEWSEWSQVSMNIHVLSDKSFQHAKQLNSFCCTLRVNVSATGEYELWKGIIGACPTLRNLPIMDDKNFPYWDINDSTLGHLRLIQEYQHKITFFSST